MQCIIENERVYAPHFTPEIRRVKCFARSVKDLELDLDTVKTNLLKLFPGWFVYRGGNHVALHSSADEERRLLLVTQ